MPTKTKLHWHPAKFLAKLDVTIDNKLSQAGDVIVDKAQANCPVKSGDLRSSIHKVVDHKDNTVSVGSELEYAKFIELGTRKSPPKSFLRKGLMQATSKIRAIFSRP